jgi:mono/diheme cytochrome c family protein
MSRPASSPNLRDLSAWGWLSAPPPDGQDYPVTGDPTTAAALGYLHANCGHCHNENGTAWPDTQMVLRLRVADRDAGTSAVFDSVVGKTLQYWRGGPITLRVSPGQPDMSALLVRMQARGNKDEMPPLATELVDTDGIGLVRSWIAALSP